MVALKKVKCFIGGFLFENGETLGKRVEVNVVLAETARACKVSQSPVVRCRRHAKSSENHYRFSPPREQPASGQTTIATGRPKNNVDKFTSYTQAQCRAGLQPCDERRLAEQKSPVLTAQTTQPGYKNWPRGEV